MASKVLDHSYVLNTIILSHWVYNMCEKGIVITSILQVGDVSLMMEEVTGYTLDKATDQVSDRPLTESEHSMCIGSLI